MARGNGKGTGNGKAKGKGKGKAKGALRAAGATKVVDRDVYSDDETEHDQKEARMNASVDVDGVYEYEQPETFDHDSEISEDEAFNSDDEEQFGMFFQKGKKQKKTDKDEEEEATEEEEDEEEGGDLLSDMLGTAPASRLSTIVTGNGNEEEEDDDDDVFDDEEEEDDETVAAKAKNLRSLVDTLVPAKKKKKHGEITDATIAASSRTRSDSSDAGELTLASLLGGDAGEDDDDATTIGNSSSTTTISKVKKQIRELEADAAASGPLSSTIAPVLEERAARKIAYEQKKEQVDLFQLVVRRNRQKETMDFREQIPKMENLTAAGLASKFSAETDLEKDVAALLQAGGLSDRAIAQDEHDELVQKKVSVDEVLARQKELSKMRALMFYDEQKARRVKKIKSKLYHKIRNNQNKKEQDKQHAQLRALDPELAKQLDDELAQKRAEERLTLKHTNTSKWVKHQLKRGIHADQGTRNAIADQLRRGDELRRKMQTVNSDDEDGDDDFSSDDDGTVDAATRLQRRLERQADALVTEIDGDEANAHDVKGLAGMKFMQRAVQKQRQKARSEAEKLLREIKGEDGLLSDGDDASSGDEGPKQKKRKKQKTQQVTVTDADKAAVAKALPRGALQTGSVSMDKGLSARADGAITVDLGDGTSIQAAVDVSQSVTTGATVEIGAMAKKNAFANKNSVEELEQAPTATEENPWLTGAATKNKKKNRKAKKNETHSDGVDVGHAMDALTKTVGKTTTSQSAQLDIAKAAATATAGTKRKAFETSTTDQPTAAPVDESSKKKTSNKKAKTTDQAEQDKLTQDELVRRAFAFADEGENELQQEKEAIAGQDTQAKKGAEIAKLVGMVGWGSWAGEGVQKSYRQTQREEMAVKLAAATKKQVLQSRKDSKMERVLINEKKDKRAAKFAVDEVPYPFTSREEYEMAMRNPLGGDWNTPAATNALTKPKVMLRAGQMLDPLRLSKEDKKQAKKELTKKRKAKF